MMGWHAAAELPQCVRCVICVTSEMLPSSDQTGVTHPMTRTPRSATFQESFDPGREGRETCPGSTSERSPP